MVERYSGIVFVYKEGSRLGPILSGSGAQGRGAQAAGRSKEESLRVCYVQSIELALIR